MALMSKGGDVIEDCEGYQLQEEPKRAHYSVVFEANIDDIGPENSLFWDVKIE